MVISFLSIHLDGHFFKDYSYMLFFFCYFFFLLLYQSVVEMAGFRSLAENEIVDFKSKNTDKGVEATVVTGPDGANLMGSEPRVVNKKRFRKTR